VTVFGNKAAGFDRPAQLPCDDDEHRRWQIANRDWWEAAPMRYDWRAELRQTPGTEAFFAEIDRRFLEAAKCFMPWRNLPFETVIPFDQLHDRDVLEIGVGHGTHAQLLARRCKSFTGIDLTTAAVRMTAQRLRLFGLPGRVLQMDAENLAFPDRSFDFVWSWGVVHHAADTRRVLKEAYRVLRPGGGCTAMVYYRSWWNYYVFWLLRGLLQGQWRSPHHVSQSGTDGALARYYKPGEWRAMAHGLFTVEAIEVYGLKSDIVPLPHSRLKDVLMCLIPDAVARFLARHLRMGSLLVVQMRKPVSA
jgi:SAM-dependent methyltransferase